MQSGIDQIEKAVSNAERDFAAICARHAEQQKQLARRIRNARIFLGVGIAIVVLSMVGDFVIVSVRQQQLKEFHAPTNAVTELEQPENSRPHWAERENEN
jgi:hypothetical protein